jgi:hypothetical protein
LNSREVGSRTKKRRPETALTVQITGVERAVYRDLDGHIARASFFLLRAAIDGAENRSRCSLCTRKHKPLLLEEDRFYARVMPDGTLEILAGVVIDGHRSSVYKSSSLPHYSSRSFHLSVNQSINQSIIQRRRDNTHRVLNSTSSSENSGITNPILSHQNCTMKILVFDLQESSCSLPSSRSTSPCFLRPHQTSSLEFSPRHVPVPSRSKGASADGQREKIDTPL